MKQMNECLIRGCRKMEWRCKECGRTATSAELMTVPTEWISVLVEDAPAMETVQLCIDGKVVAGWNESTNPEEKASYCSWEIVYGFGLEGVTHWAPLLKPVVKQ